MNKAESKYFNTAAKMDDALISILETKSFDYITVKEICERAGVNRSTFYLHYENIGELLDETMNRLIDDFLSCFSVDLSAITMRFDDCEETELNFISEKYLYPYLSYIRSNRRVFSTALQHSGIFGFERIYQKMFRYIFDPILSRFDYPADHRKYVMMFYLHGIQAIIEEWLKEDCGKEIEEIADIIHECIFGLPHRSRPDFEQR